MKLTELFLNRFLYRESLQNLETKDSVYNSGNVKAETPVPISSGGAAQDINTGNVQINGAILEPGTFPQTTLDVSNWGWGQTGAFASASSNAVSWGAGTFLSADGTSYAISAGTTGAMSVKTYIYLDLLTSTTAYQITTNPSMAVGIGKVLIGVANPGATSATYNLSQATQIVGDNILANTIDASKIMTGQLIVGTNVGIGTAQTAGQVTTIVGNTITTGFVNALNITAAGVVTGNLIQTDSGSYAGVKMSAGVGGIMVFGQSALNFSTTSGLSSGYIGASTSQQLSVYNQYGTVSVGTASGGLVFGGNITANLSIVPSVNASYNLGDSSHLWANVYAYNLSLAGGKYINVSGSAIQSNSDFRVVGSINLTGNMVFENSASITINGTAFYVTADPNAAGHYYLRS